MSTIITPNTAYFKEGEVYVYQLPEYDWIDKTSELVPDPLVKMKDGKFIRSSEFNALVSYARAHPIKVAEKDKETLRGYIWGISTPECNIQYEDWSPQDLTEYRIENLSFEIDENQKAHLV